MHCPIIYIFFFFHKLYFLSDIQTERKEIVSCKKSLKRALFRAWSKTEDSQRGSLHPGGSGQLFPVPGQRSVTHLQFLLFVESMATHRKYTLFTNV